MGLDSDRGGRGDWPEGCCGELDEGYPIEVCTEQVEDLHPGGGEEEDVGEAEGELEEQQGEDNAAEAGGTAQEGKDAEDGEEGSSGMKPAHADQQGRGRGEVGGEGCAQGG
jgi:hypothetical protein